MPGRQHGHLWHTACCRRDQEHQRWWVPGRQGLHAHALDGALHRKPVTVGCQEAIQHRVNTLENRQGVGLRQEIKTILMQGRLHTTGAPLFIALHLRADQAVDPQRLSYVLETQKLHDMGLSIPSQLDAATAEALGLASGRLNIVSLAYAANRSAVRLLQICDADLVVPDSKCAYTNAGLNTWGVEIFDLPAFIHVMQAETIRWSLPGPADQQHTVLVASIVQPPRPVPALRRSPAWAQAAWPHVAL